MMHFPFTSSYHKYITKNLKQLTLYLMIFWPLAGVAPLGHSLSRWRGCNVQWGPHTSVVEWAQSKCIRGPGPRSRPDLAFTWRQAFISNPTRDWYRSLVLPRMAFHYTTRPHGVPPSSTSRARHRLSAAIWITSNRCLRMLWMHFYLHYKFQIFS